jgi:rhodanese-related sulfurtransferase
MDIQVDELKDKLEANEKICLIDVRENYEHEEFNVGGLLIPMGEIIDNIGTLEKEKDNEVIVYCRSGNRSGMVKKMLEQLGFKNVRNLEGGMLEWNRKFGQQV